MIKKNYYILHIKFVYIFVFDRHYLTPQLLQFQNTIYTSMDVQHFTIICYILYLQQTNKKRINTKIIFVIWCHYLYYV